MKKMESQFLKEIVHACKKSLYLVGFFSFFINIFMLTVPIYMLQIFDRVLASRSYETLLYLTLIAVFVLIIMAFLEIARSRILVAVSNWLDHVLGPEALARAPDALLLGNTYGSQSMRDVLQVRQFMASPSVFTFFDSPWVPIYIVVIFLLHPWLGLLSTFGAIILFALAILNEVSTRKPLKEANTQAIVNQQFIETSLRNAEVIQATGMLPSIIQRWKKNNAPILGLQTLASNRAGVILAWSKFIRTALQIFMLGLGAYLVIHNQLTAGGMIAGSILLSRALAPVEQAIGVWKQMLAAREAYERLKQHFAQESLRTSEIELPHPQGSLTLNNVFYRVPGVEKPIIQGISLAVNPGEFVGIIGPTGAGKSTLARLMLGAIPANAGDIRLDNADVYQWQRKSFGNYVGYLPQDIELFTGSVKDNIASMGEANDEAVIKAAQLAGVHEMILHLPQGYETLITPFALSGGQRQRIALARAFYKNPCLLILDEPNSNLDQAGEVSLLNALKKLGESQVTRIIITYKPSIIKFVDRIVVIQDGRIQSMGSVQEILEKMQGTSQPRSE